ncbi:MAG: hypothetical protein KBT04_00035, partial [Bacteroidales bacterium]|nr:hypothetical protein [Candidatus Colimorpha onthohippi]
VMGSQEACSSWARMLQYRIDSLNRVVDSIRGGSRPSPAPDTTPAPATTTLTTTTVTNITATSASAGGNIVVADGVEVTARGVCWSVAENPTVGNCMGYTLDGSGAGEFTSTVTGLVGNRTYYVRAYATTSTGTIYGAAVSFVAQDPCANSTGGSSVVKGDNGALSGQFSVSESLQVRFSAGNLQFSMSGEHVCADNTIKPGKWCFAANQYDYIGCGNENVSSTYTGWIDLFGWGTSGYHNTADGGNQNYNPYSEATNLVDTVNNKYGYGPSYNQTNPGLTGRSAFYDWGVYNAISNGGNNPGRWRLLTHQEWDYLYYGRPRAAAKRGYAEVAGTHGVVFLPDNWTLPLSCTFTSGSANGWTTNRYTAQQWEDMEAAGAIFLPAAGYRSGREAIGVDNYGYYWSSSVISSDKAYGLDFNSRDFFSDNNYRYYAQSVRLVSDVVKPVSKPSLSTVVTTGITQSGALIISEITSDGGAAVTACGVCWNTTGNPTSDDCVGQTSDVVSSELFSSTPTGLSANTAYYVRAYATNSAGTAYGELISIVTLPSAPMLSTLQTAAITTTGCGSGQQCYVRLRFASRQPWRMLELVAQPHREQLSGQDHRRGRHRRVQQHSYRAFSWHHLLCAGIRYQWYRHRLWRDVAICYRGCDANSISSRSRRHHRYLRRSSQQHHLRWWGSGYRKGRMLEYIKQSYYNQLHRQDHRWHRYRLVQQHHYEPNSRHNLLRTRIRYQQRRYSIR